TRIGRRRVQAERRQAQRAQHEFVVGRSEHDSALSTDIPGPARGPAACIAPYNGPMERGDAELSETSTASGKRIGGHIVADALVGQDTDTVFGVPGESYLAVLDGLYRHRDRVRFVTCRHEGGAAF